MIIIIDIIIVNCYDRQLIQQYQGYKDFETNFIPLLFCKKSWYMNALEEFEIYAALINFCLNIVLCINKFSFQSVLAYTVLLVVFSAKFS